MPIERDDLIWAAAVFETRVRFNVIGSRPYAQANGKFGDEFLGRLHTLFGGALYTFGANVQRWQIGGDALTAFAEAIRPHLSESGLRKLEDLIALCATLAAVKETRRVARRSVADATAIEATRPPQRLSAFNLLDGIDEDQQALILAWDSLDAEDGIVALRALTIEHAERWSEMLRDSGFKVERKYGVYLFVQRPL